MSNASRCVSATYSIANSTGHDTNANTSSARIARAPCGRGGAVAPAVAALADRRPIEPARLATRVPLHVVAAVVFALVHTLLMACVYLAFRWTPPECDLRDAWTRLTLSYFGVDILVYAAT